MINSLNVFSLATTGGASPYTSIIMLVAMFAIFYLVLIRPQKKKDKEVKQMRDSLSIGDEIITIGGIHGKVVKIGDDTIVLELSHGKQRITFSKWAIGSVDKKGKETVNENVEIEAIEENQEDDTKTEDK